MNPLNYSQFVVELSRAVAKNDGHRLSVLLSPVGPEADALLKGLQESSRLALSRIKETIASPWNEVAIAHVQVLVHYSDQNYLEAYNEQSAMAKAFLRAFVTQGAWMLPALYAILKDLRTLAEKADDAQFQKGITSVGAMEDAARICNKAFTDCVMDRNTGHDTRKWGVYHVVGLIFKCYFSLNRITLSRNIIRALHANTDIPDVSRFPRGDQVTYRYYIGLLAFLNEQYEQSERDLSWAFDNCHQSSTRNLELILNYLIPLRLLRGQMPSEDLLLAFPRLDETYRPFLRAIRSGDVKGYDAALNAAEERLVEMGVLLTVEKAREMCLRGLFKKVWLVLDKPTRLMIVQFHQGLQVSGLTMPVEETECLLANMIYKGYMRGYLSHERQMLVLAKGDSAFPRLTERKL